MEMLTIHWLKSRTLVLWVFITTILAGLLLGGLFTFEVPFYLAIVAWLIWKFRARLADLKHIIGGAPSDSKAWMSLTVVLPLIVLSFGTICLTFYLLSLIAVSPSDLFNKNQPAKFPTDSPLYNATEFLIAVIVAPIVEEVLFRGVLLHRWSTKWGLSRAMLATSITFGVLHLDLIGATIFGYVMAVLYVKTGTLVIPIACHTINNVFVLVSDILVSAFETRPTDEAFDNSQTYILVGVSCLLISVPYLLYFIRKNKPPVDRSGVAHA